MKLRCCLLLLLLSFLLLSLATVADETVDALLARISQSMPSVLHYRETHYSALYAEPVVYSGTLEYDVASGTLRKRTNEPIHATLSLDEHFLVIEVNGKRRKVSLRRHAVLQTMASGYRTLATGRSELLSEAFNLTLQERERGEWTLELLPRSKQLSKAINLIQIRGQQDRVEEMVTDLVSGDRQTLLFIHEP